MIGQTRKGLISPTEEFGFYPDRSGESMEAHFYQGKEKVRHFLEDRHSRHWIQNVE